MGLDQTKLLKLKFLEAKPVRKNPPQCDTAEGAEHQEGSKGFEDNTEEKEEEEEDDA